MTSTRTAAGWRHDEGGRGRAASTAATDIVGSRHLRATATTSSAAPAAPSTRCAAATSLRLVLADVGARYGRAARATSAWSSASRTSCAAPAAASASASTASASAWLYAIWQVGAATSAAIDHRPGLESARRSGRAGRHRAGAGRTTCSWPSASASAGSRHGARRGARRRPRASQQKHPRGEPASSPATRSGRRPAARPGRVVDRVRAARDVALQVRDRRALLEARPHRRPPAPPSPAPPRRAGRPSAGRRGSGSGHARLQQRQLVLQPHRLHQQRDGGHRDVGLDLLLRGPVRPVNENSPSSGDWKSWKTASSPDEVPHPGPRDVALEEEDLGDLAAGRPPGSRSGCPSGASRSASGSRWPGRRTCRLPWSCLVEARGTLSVVASSRRASTRHRFRAKAGSVSIRSRNTALSSVNSSACSGRAHGRRCAASP